MNEALNPSHIKVVFAGTPHFADAALQALLKHRFNVVGVLTQPDRPSGRGLKLTPSPVKHTALAHNIPVHQPRSLRLDGKYPEDAADAQAVAAALVRRLDDQLLDVVDHVGALLGVQAPVARPVVGPEHADLTVEQVTPVRCLVHYRVNC